MSQSKPESKIKHFKKTLIGDHDKLRRSEELLKEVDSLALLLEEVKRQSQKIQAAADAIGDAVFEVYSHRPELVMNIPQKRESSIANRLTPRSRSDRPFSV